MRPFYKLLAVDIDGTLLDGNGLISPAVRAALERAQRAGMTVALATGRRHRTAALVAADLGVCSHVISQHGALIKQTSDDKTVWSAPMERSLAGEVAGMMNAAGLTPVVLLDGYEAGIDFVVITDGEADPRKFGFTGDAWRAAARFEIPEGLDVLEVASYDDGGRASAVEAEIVGRYEGRLNVHVIKHPSSPVHCLEVISREAGKGNALLALAGRLGLKREETAAVGDDVNDIDMLEKAGFSMAMGNATDAVKASADTVVAANTADGLAEAVDKALAARGSLLERPRQVR